MNTAADNWIQQWPQIKRQFRRAINHSAHAAIASINADGTPHLTPIGSLMLTTPGRGIYFEQFTTRLPENVWNNPNICVLAVNSGKWFWLAAILKGRFSAPPAIRLSGIAGKRRAATRAEIKCWQKQVNGAQWTKGYQAMWAGMATVREIQFTAYLPIEIGAMTRQNPEG